MPWTGSSGAQSFQRTDGTRTGSTTWAEADAAGVDIITTDHDTHDQDIADGLSSCLKNDGGNSATSNIPMGGFRLQNLGAAVARTDSIKAGDVQDNLMSYCSVSGTANAINLTNTVPITTYRAGQEFRFTATYTNTSSVTIAVDGLAAKNVTVAGVALTTGQIVAGAWITVAYNGTNFELTIGTTPAAIAVGSVMAWPLSTVPTGWLEADGSAVSRTTYSALFAAYGTAYGAGDGSTTFNLPNYKDYFLRGFDASGTNASSRTDRGDGTIGANVGTKQGDDYKQHNHTFTGDPVVDHTHTVDVPNASTSAGGSFAYLLSNNNAGTHTFTSSSAGGHTPSGTISNAPATGGTETRPKNITVKWIILALPSAAFSIASDVLFCSLTADYTLTDGASAQKAFNASTTGAVTLAGSTAYDVDMLLIGTNTGTTSHTWGILFGGTATITAAGTMLKVSAYTATSNALTAESGIYIVGAGISSVTAVTAASTSATENVSIRVRGRININASGTLIPQVKFSAQPNGTEKILAGSFISLRPVGTSTITTNGAWT